MATKRIIQYQEWQVDDKHFQMKLLQPYWGAWKQFGWEQGVEGISISLMAINMAKIEEKKLLIDMDKYGKYEISPHKAFMEGKETVSRGNIRLLCIPRTAFKKYEI